MTTTATIILALLLTIAAGACIVAWAVRRERRLNEAALRDLESETDQQAQRPVWRPE